MIEEIVEVDKGNFEAWDLEDVSEMKKLVLDAQKNTVSICCFS